MSTRSLIAAVQSDGTVTSIYCHHDGYPDYNGKYLVQYYQDPAKIQQLLKLGDISILDKNIGQRINFDDRETRAANEQVLAYGRDRREKGTQAERFHTVDDWLNEVGQMDYHYLFDNGRWTCYDSNKKEVQIPGNTPAPAPKPPVVTYPADMDENVIVKTAKAILVK